VSQLNSKHESERQIATQCLIRIFSSIQFLTRQGLAVRGNTESDGNLIQLLKCRSADVPYLKQWLMRQNYWLSPQIQNEIIQQMALTILRHLATDINKCTFFGFMADETTYRGLGAQRC